MLFSALTLVALVAASAAVLGCTTAHLKVVLGQEGGAAGSVGVTGVGFEDTSTSPCTLKGSPTLQLLDAKGSDLPTFNLPGNIFSGVVPPASGVLLTTGQSAKFDILFAAQTGYGNAYCPTSTSVVMTPPGSKTGIKMPWKIRPYGGGTIQALRCGELRVSAPYGP
jgi:hypothetical protein